MAKGIVANQERRLIKKITHISKTLANGVGADVDSLAFTVDLTKSIIANVQCVNSTSLQPTHTKTTVNFSGASGVIYSRVGTTGDVNIEFDIIEYESVKAVYQNATGGFTTTVSSAIGASVDTSKSLVEFSYNTSEINTLDVSSKLDDISGVATDVDFTTQTGETVNQLQYFVVEFY